MIASESIEQPVSLSMSAYSGPWTEVEAAHLLRRTMFGPTLEQIRTAVSDGLNTTVSKLMTIPTVNPPLTTSSDDGIAQIGETWIDKVYPADLLASQKTDDTRNMSLASWMLNLINIEDVSIAQKMCLFWQNHFAANLGFDARANFY